MATRMFVHRLLFSDKNPRAKSTLPGATRRRDFAIDIDNDDDDDDDDNADQLLTTLRMFHVISCPPYAGPAFANNKYNLPIHLIVL